MIASFYDRKLAKLKFFAVYSVSVLLVVVLTVSLLRANSAGTENSPSKRLPVNGDGLQQDLSSRFARLGYSLALVVSSDPTAVNEAVYQTNEKELLLQLDSIRQQVALVKDAAFRQQQEAKLNAYETGIRQYSNLIYKRATASDTASGKDGVAKEAVQSLKNLLAEKEKQIGELERQKQDILQERNQSVTRLQQQLDARPASGVTTGGDDRELRNKAENLRVQNEKYASQIKSLTASYKQVIEDNRRLLTQLQSARGGKSDK